MTKEEIDFLIKKEIVQFMSYFESEVFDFNNEKLLEKMKNNLTRVVDLELLDICQKFDSHDKFSGINLRFVRDEKDRSYGIYSDNVRIKDGAVLENTPMITLNIEMMCRNLNSQSREERLNICKEIFKTIFHEIEHHRQLLMIRTGISSSDNIRYARTYALHRYLKDEWYLSDTSEDNYDYDIRENDADFVANKRYLEVTGEEDSQMRDLMFEQKDRFYSGRYVVDIDSRDGMNHYQSDGYQLRDDVEIPILDNLICENKNIEILRLYPILLKEYNIDGSKKSVIQLIENMETETNSISATNGLNDSEKKELIKNCQQMYYELIYNQLENANQKQINEMVAIIGREKCKDIFNNICDYFFDIMEQRMVSSAIQALTKTEAAKEITKDGTLVLIDKSIVSVKQYIEQYNLFLQGKIERLEVPAELIMNQPKMRKINSWFRYNRFCMFEYDAYEEKYEKLSKLGEYVSEYEPTEEYSLFRTPNIFKRKISKVKTTKTLKGKISGVISKINIGRFFSPAGIMVSTKDVSLQEINSIIDEMEEDQVQRDTEDEEMLKD